MDNLTKEVTEEILSIADKYELTRNELLLMFVNSIHEFDEISTITNKRKCSRSEREHKLIK